MKMTVVLALAAAACLGSFSRGGATADPDLCKQTSDAARRACRAQVEDELWTAIGACSNVADASARKACRRAAKDETREVREECAAQFEARQDLCEALGRGAYDPAIDPARFLGRAAIAASPNPFFPLVPGTTWVYEGGGEAVTVTVTDATKVLLGVTCIVVRDVVEVDGVVVEDTDDYFAQDVEGNVWYFGELAKNFEAGELRDLGGSWRAGEDGARPGIIMKATPTVGDIYRQEFFLGEAEDAGEVLSVTGSATVPAASCTNECVVTRDFTPLEPDANEEKTYSRGIGLILEVDVETGERVELVSFTAG